MHAPSRAWVRTGVGVIVAGALVFTVPGSAPAHAAPVKPTPAAQRHVPFVAPRVVEASTCVQPGAIDVTYDAQEAVGHQMVPLLDDSAHRTVVEIHDYSGRWGNDSVGRWLPMPVSYGREHWVRWTGYRDAGSHGSHFDKVRSVTGGYTSVPMAIDDRCA